MARAKIGDIIEIKYPNNLYYAQYTHKLPKYLDLIQVADKSFKQRPDNLELILDCDIRIITFTGLSVLLLDDEFEVIGNAPVPESRKKFPVFRVAGHITKEGIVTGWKFWDGGESWPEKFVKKISKEQQKLPVRELWSIDVLLKRIESGWTHDKTLGY